MAHIIITSEGPTDTTRLYIDGVEVDDVFHFRLEQGLGEVPVLIVAVKVTKLEVVAKGDVNTVDADTAFCTGCGRLPDQCVCPPHLRST